MTSTKRKISDLLNETEYETTSSRPRTRPHLDATPPASKPTFAQVQTRTQTLSYPRIPSDTPLKQTPFQQPTPLVSFSKTPDRTVEFTDSSLRYFVEPPQGAQLGYGYEGWVPKVEERGRVDGLVEAVSRVKSAGAADVGVVAWRGVMTRILTSPYEEREGWEMNVMSAGGTLYFEEHRSEETLKEKNDMAPKQRLQTYYGYAFESYCTSATPVRQHASSDNSTDPPGWGGAVDTNVQWCSVVRTKLGDTRMIIGGEVDCVRGKYTGKTDTFVELKTSLVIKGHYDDVKFERKLLKFYFQSFLLGVPEIVVGFRTPSGQVQTVQSFKTIHIPRLVRGKPGSWDPLVCLAWGHQFLTFLKGVVHSSTATGPATVWRVKFVPKVGVRIEVLESTGVQDVENGEDRVGFLPRWYWKELEAKGGSTSPARHTGSSHAATLQNEGTRVPEQGKLPVPQANAGWQI